MDLVNELETMPDEFFPCRRWRPRCVTAQVSDYRYRDRDR